MLVLYTFQQGSATISVSSEKDAIHCQSVYEDESLEKRKLLLFAPYIFFIAENVAENVSQMVIRNGGTLVSVLDEEVSHVVCNALSDMENMKPRKDIIHVTPCWVADCVRLSALLSPFRPKYHCQ